MLITFAFAKPLGNGTTLLANLVFIGFSTFAQAI
jgi:hypothetical protein